MPRKGPKHVNSTKQSNQKQEVNPEQSTNMVSIYLETEESNDTILNELSEHSRESGNEDPLAPDPAGQNEQHIFNVSLVKKEFKTELEEFLNFDIQENEPIKNTLIEDVNVKQELYSDNEDVHFPNPNADEDVDEYCVYNTHEDVELTIDSVKIEININELKGTEMNVGSNSKRDEVKSDLEEDRVTDVKISENECDIDNLTVELFNEDETENNVDDTKDGQPLCKKRKTSEEIIEMNDESSCESDEFTDSDNEVEVLRVQAPSRTYERKITHKKKSSSCVMKKSSTNGAFVNDSYEQKLRKMRIAETHRKKRQKMKEDPIKHARELERRRRKRAENKMKSKKETRKTPHISSSAENTVNCVDKLEDPTVTNESIQSKTTTSNTKVLCLEQFHNCLFCSKKFTNIFAHFVEKHSSQRNISCCLDKPKNKKLHQFVHLKRIGDFVNNVYYLKNTEGKLIVLTQSERFLYKCVSEKFIPCLDCTGFIHESQLFRHYCKCIAKQPRHITLTKKKLLKESRLFLKHALSSTVSNTKLSCRAGNNKFVIVALNDHCLSLLGKHMMQIKSQSDDKKDVIRTMMERMGYVVTTCRRLAGNDYLTMSEILMPHNVDLLIMSVRAILLLKTESLQKLDLSTDLFSKINSCVFILRSKCLLKGKVSKAVQYLQFYYKFREMWEKEIGNQEVNKRSDLPLISNLINLKKTLESTIVKLTDQIKISKYNINNIWCDLAESTLCLLCLFNADELSAVEQLKITEYAVRPDWSVDELDHYKDRMPNFTYHLAAKRFVVCTYYYGKKFYLLFTKAIKKAIDVLISSRYRTSISPNNGFVFANLNYSTSCLKSVNCLYNLCVKTGYINSDVLKDVKIRIYLSFLTQIIDMSPEEATWAITSDLKSGKNFKIKEIQLHQALDVWRNYRKKETNSSTKQQGENSDNT